MRADGECGLATTTRELRRLLRTEKTHLVGLFSLAHLEVIFLREEGIEGGVLEAARHEVRAEIVGDGASLDEDRNAVGHPHAHDPVHAAVGRRQGEQARRIVVRVEHALIEDTRAGLQAGPHACPSEKLYSSGRRWRIFTAFTKVPFPCFVESTRWSTSFRTA